MAITYDQIDLWRASVSETQNLEFKEAKTQYGTVNQLLHERFWLSESSSNTVSQIITAATDQKLIKIDPNAPDSRRYARYIPAWA